MFQKYGTNGKEIDMKTSMVLRPGSAALSNRALTLRLLFSHGALSRTDIADSLEITTAAVTSIVGELLEEGLVVQQAAPENTRGAFGVPELTPPVGRHTFAVILIVSRK